MRIGALGRSAASWALWCLLAVGAARAQPADAPCSEVEGLDPARVAALPRSALCRMAPEARQCMAGLTLAVDVKGERDLCLSRDGRPVQRPRCAARFRKTYRQALHGRLKGVREPQGTPTIVVVKHGDVTREETLVQVEPVVGPGPDRCPFARTLRMDFHPPRTKGVPPIGKEKLREVRDSLPGALP